MTSASRSPEPAPLALDAETRARLKQLAEEAVVARFWARVDKSGECWIWTGAKSRRVEYGQFSVASRKVLAHRFSWELVNGAIPDGLFVCHNCPGGDNKSCVNPAHLWLGTNAENVLDTFKKGRVSANAGRTHCKWGHLLSGSNLRIAKTGVRLCIECRRAMARKHSPKRYYLHVTAHNALLAAAAPVLAAWDAGAPLDTAMARLREALGLATPTERFAIIEPLLTGESADAC